MSDLVTGIMNSLYDPTAIGQTYEAVGPDRLTQAELLTFMYALTTRTKEAGTFKITELMIDPATFVRAFLVGKSPFGMVNSFHQYNLDRLERDSISDNLEGYPNLTDLGVKLHTIEDKMPWEVKQSVRCLCPIYLMFSRYLHSIFMLTIIMRDVMKSLLPHHQSIYLCPRKEC